MAEAKGKSSGKKKPKAASTKEAKAAKSGTSKKAPPRKGPAPAKKTPSKASPKKAEPKKQAPKKGPKKKVAPKKAPAKAASKKAAPKKAPEKKTSKKAPAQKAAAKKTEPKKATQRQTATPEETAPAPTPEVELPKEEGVEKAEGAPPEEVTKPLATLLLFGRWDLSEVQVQDPGLARYMNLSPTFLPHTGGRWANRPFSKGRVNLVERLANNMMRTEDYTGKKGKTVQAVKRAFEILEKKAKKNPVQVLIDAIENSAPREEITRLRFGGISVPRAVDIAPSRRLDLALRHICTGAVQASYKNPKPIYECLADEVMLASRGDMNSFAIGRKEELERVAASAR